MPAAVAVAGPEAVVAGRRHPRKNAHLRNVPLGSRAGQAVFVTTPSAEPRSQSPAVVSPPRICNAAIWREYWDGLLQDRDRAPASQPALRFPPPIPDTPSSDDIATEDGVDSDTFVPRSQSPCPPNAVTSSPPGAPAVADETGRGLPRAEQQRAATVAGETRNDDGTTLSLIDVDPDPRRPGAVLVTVDEPAIARGDVSVFPPAARLTSMGLSLVDVLPDPRWPGAV